MRVTLLLLLLLTGCLGDHGERVTRPDADAFPPTTVVMENFSFYPQDLNVSRGQAVTWVNADDVDHHVAAEDGSFDSGRVAAEGRYEHTFDEPGQYPYRCAIHAGMVGTIQVR